VNFENLEYNDPRLIEAVEACNKGFEDFVLAEVRAGEAKALGCENGVIVIRAEETELVFVTGYGKNGKETLEILEAYAVRYGFETIRIHAEKLSIGRLYGLGDPAEYVWRKHIGSCH
jgi:hypothetical protein